jgi:hypothetical protein
MAKGNSKYTDQGKKKNARYKRKKYPSGVQYAEEQPEPNGYDVAGETTQWAQTGGKMAGPGGAVAGAAIGLGLSLYNRKKIKEANRQIKAEKEAYEEFGGYATDPKLMMDPDATAKKGLRSYKSKVTKLSSKKANKILEDGSVYGKRLSSKQKRFFGAMAEGGESSGNGVIEIEGKNGVGEIHTDADFNVKSVGTTPHTKGGDKVKAAKGDVVFNTQGKPEKFDKVMGKINRYKAGGSKIPIEQERRKLPTDDAPKKVDGDENVVPGSAPFIPQQVMDDKRAGVAPVEDTPGNAPAMAPFVERGTLDEEFGNPQGIDYDPNKQRLVYDQEMQKSFDDVYQTDNPYHAFLANPENQKQFKAFQETEATDPTGTYKQFQDFMVGQGINSGDYLQYLRDQGLDPGTEGYGVGDARNLETKSLAASLRYMDQYNSDQSVLDKGLYTVEDLPQSVPTSPADAATLTEEEVETEEKETGKGKAKKVGKAITDKLSRNANVMGNLLDSMGGIEGYNKSALKLNRYKYQDLSAPQIKEANVAGAIRRKNRRGLVGSKGQQVSQAAQDEVMMQKAKERILNKEIERKLRIENANVDLSNAERKFAAGEDVRAKDIERMQRAKNRKFGRAATAELTQMHNIDKQREYMMSRDEKLYARDNMLASILGSRSYDLNVTRDAEGKYNKDVEKTLREPYRMGIVEDEKKEEAETPKTTQPEKKRKGTNRYK